MFITYLLIKKVSTPVTWSINEKTNTSDELLAKNLLNNLQDLLVNTKSTELERK
jgi:hypothetical protein